MFTWTDEKNRANKEKHGFYLSDIVDVFDDPHLIDWYDAVHHGTKSGTARGGVIL